MQESSEKEMIFNLISNGEMIQDWIEISMQMISKRLTNPRRRLS